MGLPVTGKQGRQVAGFQSLREWVQVMQVFTISGPCMEALPTALREGRLAYKVHNGCEPNPDVCRSLATTFLYFHIGLTRDETQKQEHYHLKGL